MDSEGAVDVAERAMRLLEVAAGFVLVGLFAVGLLDLLVQTGALVRGGRIASPQAVIGLIDEILLLLVVAEIFRTVTAYVRQRSVLRTVVVAGLIAVTRKVITFNSGAYPTATAAAVSAVGYAVLLLALVAALLVVRRRDARESVAADE